MNPTRRSFLSGLLAAACAATLRFYPAPSVAQWRPQWWIDADAALNAFVLRQTGRPMPLDCVAIQNAIINCAGGRSGRMTGGEHRNRRGEWTRMGNRWWRVEGEDCELVECDPPPRLDPERPWRSVEGWDDETCSPTPEAMRLLGRETA